MKANYRFGQLPDVYRKRYPFPAHWRHSTTAPVGKLVPLPPKEVLPGSTWSINMSDLVQLSSTFIRPIMDDVYIDTYAFFVPLRILYDDFEKVFGNPSPSQYTSPSFALLPRMEGNEGSGGFVLNVPVGTVLDHLGLPTFADLAGSQYSALPARANAFIWNEFFANQNVDQQVSFNKDLDTDGENPNSLPWSPTNYTGQLPPVSRFMDYFSTLQLSPQKGPAVRIPGFVSDFPVFATSSSNSLNNIGVSATSLGFYNATPSIDVNNKALGLFGSGNSFVTKAGTQETIQDSGARLIVNNLHAFPNFQSDATISSLRTAFQIQKYYERDAVFGSRYREYLYASYGVTSDDASLQIPQFLAHGHHRLDITSVASTSDAVSGDSQTYPVGQFAGSSRTAGKQLSFTKSFTEHGYLFFCFAIRYKHLYSQGIDKLWKRYSRTDFYDPLFANISQQAVMLDELWGEAVSGSTMPNDFVLGYQDAWSEYRTFQSSVSGQMRPNPTSDGLGKYWSLADFYTAQPSLSDLIHETQEPWDRVLSVSTSVQDPFIIDFDFKGVVSMVVPYSSIPGYADHH